MASMASSFVGSILVARVMGPTALGYYNYVLWIAGVTTLFGALGIPAATRKYAAELRGRGDLAGARDVVAATARLQRMLAVAVCLVGGAIIFLVSGPEHRVYSLITLLSVGPSLMMSTYAAGLMAAEDFASQVVSSVISTLVNLFGVTMTLVFHWGLVGLASSLLASRVVDFAIRRWMYMRKVHNVKDIGSGGEGLSPELRRRMVRFCAYSVTLLLLNLVVWDRSELFFLKMFCDIKEVAFYSIGFNIVQQMISMLRVFTTPATARLMVEFGQDRRISAETAGMASRYLAVIALPAVLGMAAISSPLVKVAYGSAYGPATQVLAIAASFSIVRVFLGPADQLLLANDRQSTLLKWSIWCALLNVVLDLILIRAHGAVGAAVANGVTQFIATTGSWTLATRCCGARFPFASTGRLLLASTIMAAGVAACSAGFRPAIALATGIPIGIALYILSIRVLRPFDATDLARLMLAAKLLPRPGARLFAAALSFAIPRSLQEKREAAATAV